MKLALLLAVAVAALVAASAAPASTRGECYTSVRIAGSVYSGVVARSWRTSCPFARNVLRASLRLIVRRGGAGDGDFYTRSYSPVTDRWYRVHCDAHGDLYDGAGMMVDCRAGVGARVRYRAWGS